MCTLFSVFFFFSINCKKSTTNMSANIIYNVDISCLLFIRMTNWVMQQCSLHPLAQFLCFSFLLWLHFANFFFPSLMWAKISVLMISAWNLWSFVSYENENNNPNWNINYSRNRRNKQRALKIVLLLDYYGINTESM